MSIPAPAPPPEPPATRAPLRVVSGCPRGRHERLYAANLGLVGQSLTHFPFLTGERREDAYAAGLLGLWQAAKRFDATRGFTFSTYASDYIRGHILRLLNREKAQQRVPVVSLETPIHTSLGKGGGDLSEVIADEQAERPGQRALDQAGFEALLSALPGRQQDLLRAVYQDERPLSSVAAEWGLTKQRCGQIHLQALARLRHSKAFGLSGADVSARG